MVALFVGALAEPRPALAASYLFPSFGAAGNFAIFGITAGTGYIITENGDTIKGNEGISQNGTITDVTAPSTVTGNLYEYGPGQYTGLNTGSPVNTTTVTTMIGQAYTDYTTAIGIITNDTCTATFCLGNQTTARTLTGTGGVTVVDFTNITLNNVNLTLSGGATDYFVVRVSGAITLTGTASIVLTGITASHVIFDVVGNVSTNGSTESLSGYIISTGGTITFTSGTTINGELIGKTMSLTGTTVNGFTPEAPTLWLIGGALVGIAVWSKRARAPIPARD